MLILISLLIPFIEQLVIVLEVFYTTVLQFIVSILQTFSFIFNSNIDVFHAYHVLFLCKLKSDVFFPLQ